MEGKEMTKKVILTKPKVRRKVPVKSLAKRHEDKRRKEKYRGKFEE
jgi:hypothetical protein